MELEEKEDGWDVKETVASAGSYGCAVLSLYFFGCLFPLFSFFAVLMPLSSLRRDPTHATLVCSFGGQFLANKFVRAAMRRIGCRRGEPGVGPMAGRSESLSVVSQNEPSFSYRQVNAAKTC